MRTWLVGLGLLAGLLPSPSVAQDAIHGTAIAAIRTSNQIVVAADSRAVNEKNDPLNERICKIVDLGKVFVAVHGMSDHRPSGFSALSILPHATANAQTVAEILDRLELLINEPLSLALEDLRRSAPIVFKQNALDMAPLGFIFVSLERDTPVLASLRFTVAGPGTGPVKLIAGKRYCPGPDCPDGRASVLVGSRDDQELFKRTHPNFWDGDLVEVARAFVQMEIDKGLVDVGPPIDILQITKAGPKWIQRKAECQSGAEIVPKRDSRK